MLVEFKKECSVSDGITKQVPPKPNVNTLSLWIMMKVKLKLLNITMMYVFNGWFVCFLLLIFFFFGVRCLNYKTITLL